MVHLRMGRLLLFWIYDFGSWTLGRSLCAPRRVRIQNPQSKIQNVRSLDSVHRASSLLTSPHLDLEPDALSLDQAALVGCAVLTGFGAVRNAGRVQAGDRVAVIGCGGVGLQVIAAARLAGAESIG